MRRDSRALRGVDLVHRLFDSRVRRDVRHERVHDLIPESLHRLAQQLLHALRDLFLALEHVVQLDPRHRRSHDVEHVRPNLRLGIRQFVKRVVQSRLVHRQHLILRAHDDRHEHVILRLRLHAHVQRLHARRHRPRDRLPDERVHEVAPLAREERKLPALLDHLHRARGHAREAAAPRGAGRHVGRRRRRAAMCVVVAMRWA